MKKFGILSCFFSWILVSVSIDAQDQSECASAIEAFVSDPGVTEARLSSEEIQQFISLTRKLLPESLSVAENRQIKTPAGFVRLSRNVKPDDKIKFLELARKLNPALGAQFTHTYLGTILGDRGLAFYVMSLGDLLGLWSVVSPWTLRMFEGQDEMNERVKEKMVERGFFLIVRRDEFQSISDALEAAATANVGEEPVQR